MGAAGQPLARGVEALAEVVDVVRDGDVHQRHQDLATDADRDARPGPATGSAGRGRRTKLLVPRTPLASQAAPKKPAHSPNSVDTMYQVGGSLSLVMAVSEAELAPRCRRRRPRRRRPGSGRPGSRGRRRGATSRPTPASRAAPRRQLVAERDVGTRRELVAERRPSAAPGGARRGAPRGWWEGAGPDPEGPGRGRAGPSGPAGGAAGWRRPPGDPAVGGRAGVRTLFGPLDHPPTIPTGAGSKEAARRTGRGDASNASWCE